MNRAPIDRYHGLSVTLLLIILSTIHCTNESSTAPKTHSPAPTTLPAIQNLRAQAHDQWLLLSQAQFIYETDAKTGKTLPPKPGPSKLTIVKFEGDQIQTEILQDPESRVFHKTTCSPKADGSIQLTTISASKAQLKKWLPSSKGWQANLLWEASFGGKWDRLRDFEYADLDKDGFDEIIVGTHDQGVIAIGKRAKQGWKFRELHREPDTFIHEIESGDIDGDGLLEFFATPSRPNRVGHSQGGRIIGFNRKRGGQWHPFEVANFQKRHAKEILVTDIDEDGKDEIYAAIEAQKQKDSSGTKIIAPLQIKAYKWSPKGIKGKLIATLKGGIQARFIIAGKFSTPNRNQLIVTTMRNGVWLLTPPKKRLTKWRVEQLDAETSGWEHAATLADLDGNGLHELYTTPDDQDALYRYHWTGQKTQKTKLIDLEKHDLTWAIEPCFPPLPKTQ